MEHTKDFLLGVIKDMKNAHPRFPEAFIKWFELKHKQKSCPGKTLDRITGGETKNDATYCDVLCAKLFPMIENDGYYCPCVYTKHHSDLTKSDIQAISQDLVSLIKAGLES